VKLHLKIGDLLLFQDKPQSRQPQWLAAFKAGLAIAEGLVKRDPATIELQHDLLTCQIRLAWCYYLMAEVNKALKVYKEALATNELLMSRDPKAIEGRFLLWAGLFCCGEILVKRGSDPKHWRPSRHPWRSLKPLLSRTLQTSGGRSGSSVLV
jgi:hypothetical protein